MTCNRHRQISSQQLQPCLPQERVHIFDSSLPGWRAWEQRDFDTFRDWSSVSLSQRKVWISTAPPSQIGSRLPLPVWPEQFSEVGMGAGVQDGPVGAATGTLLPAKLRGWGRCGDWRGPPRRGKNGKEYFHGCPQVWAERGVLYSESREHILSRMPWRHRMSDACVAVHSSCIHVSLKPCIHPPASVSYFINSSSFLNNPSSIKPSGFRRSTGCMDPQLSAAHSHCTLFKLGLR